MNSFISVNLTTDELQQLIKSAIGEALAGITTPTPPTQAREGYATRHEICSYYKMSLAKLHGLDKSGVFQGYRIGGRVLYKWTEVDAALQTKINAKNRRAAK